jgi:parallel beta-helix repeat protein
MEPLLRAGFFVAFSVFATVTFGQGSLTPPGAPAPTMKTLQQVEPRVPIAAVPFAISNPGSYYLTTNLQAAVGGAGIRIDASNVTLDLNGFTLGGAVNSGHGLAVTAGVSNIVIRNGSIRNWQGAGVFAGSTAQIRVEGVNAYGNGEHGIWVGDGSSLVRCTTVGNFTGLETGNASHIINCSALNNRSTGVIVRDSCVISDALSVSNSFRGITAGADVQIMRSTIGHNNNLGIVAGAGAIIQSCRTVDNDTGGILTGNGSLISQSTAAFNTGTGIAAGQRSVVVESLSESNQTIGIQALAGTVRACHAVGNTTVGIAVGDGGLVEGCQVRFNGAVGINAGNGVMIDRCHITFNGADGIRAGISCRIVGNLCYRNGETGAGAGIWLFSGGAHAEDNVVNNNDWGIYAAGGQNFILRNKATGNGTNYFAVAGNVLGPVVSAASVGTNQNPHANYAP